MDTVTANGIKIACEVFGDASDEAVLLIAGLGTQMVRWTPGFCKNLAAKGFFVVRFDNRDSGCSSHFDQLPTPDFGTIVASLMAGQRPDVPYSLNDLAADTVGLMDALKIEKAHLVGRSMGGMVAQIVATQYPERVLSLTSIMSSTGNPGLPQAAPDVMALMAGPAPDPHVDREGYLAYSLKFARRIAGTGFPFDEEAHRAIVLEELRRSGDRTGLARQIAAIAVTGDRRAQLATVKAPTLVVHGADDPLVPPASGKDTASSIPGAEYLLVEGMGHEIPAGLEATIIDHIVRIAQVHKDSA